MQRDEEESETQESPPASSETQEEDNGLARAEAAMQQLEEWLKRQPESRQFPEILPRKR